MLIRQQTRWLFRKGGCGTFDEGSEKSGDGGFADESGEELELKTGQRCILRSSAVAILF